MAETNHTRKDPWGIAPTEKWREKANLRHFENRREEGPGDKVEEKAVGRWDEGSLGVGSREQGGTRRGIRYENDGVARRTF